MSGRHSLAREFSMPHRLRLLQLTSPSLPIGAFAYSQGLEQAVERKWVQCQATLEQWITTQLEETWQYHELPIYYRCYQALQNPSDKKPLSRFLYWAAYWYASRESKELREEAQQTARALRTILNQLIPNNALTQCSDIHCPPALFAVACQHWKIDAKSGAQGLCWSWVENQAIAATKLMPLGQSDCQHLLSRLIPKIEHSCQTALSIPDDAVGQSLPAIAIASSNHENQYCRLFRS